jgi:hypothetical protein
MRTTIKHSFPIIAAAALLGACQTDQGGGGTASAGTNATTDGAGTSAGGDTSAGAGTSNGSSGSGAATSGGGESRIPALVNVNLQNVLNDLSVSLNIDRANIPVNAQIPIDVAANVCGVSVNVLSLSTGGQASCTAKTATPQLAQVVQQQISAGGSVGGGAQGGSTATTGGATGTAGSGTSGSSGTGATSSGGTGNTTPQQ